MLNLEIQEGQAMMAAKRYVKEYGHSTAVTLRLSGPFKTPVVRLLRILRLNQ